MDSDYTESGCKLLLRESFIILFFFTLSIQAKEFIRASDCGELKQRDGHIDVAKTIEALEKVYANAITLELGYIKQWEDFQNFLPEANKKGIKVYLILPDARYGVCSPEENPPDPDAPSWYCKLPKPYGKDYIRWIDTLAHLSLEYPVLKGVFIDDFECGASCTEYAGFTVDYIRRVMEVKNRINPDFQFIPGIYLPRGLSDFEIKQSYYCEHNSWMTLTAEVKYEGEVDEAFFELITSGYSSEYFIEQILINGEIKFEKELKSPRLVKIDLKDYDLRNLTITYKLIHTGYANYLDWFVLPRLVVNGSEIELDWRQGGDECYKVNEYLKWLKEYYVLTDGVIFWSNQFDLINPENEIIEELLDIARERIGEEKIIFGHFYGAEPWREPVFPSDYYFDTFAKINIQKTDGVAPWYSFLLAYYVDYSSEIYSQSENDRPEYKYRFFYPGYTSYEVGFYQGIEARVKLPDTVSDASISFRIEDSYRGDSYYRRWVKEFVVKSGIFDLNFPCVDGKNCLWFKERGTVWWDFIAGDEGAEEISIPYEDLKEFLTPGKEVVLALRMRADEFRGAGSAPPDVNVYITEPVLKINGREIPLDWRFVSGNVMEKLWLRSSEKIRELYKETGIESRSNQSERVSLKIYPNPSLGKVVILYQTSRPVQFCVEIYNSLGRLVQRIQGYERIEWDMRDLRGRRVSSGVYFCRLKTPKLALTKKFVVIE